MTNEIVQFQLNFLDIFKKEYTKLIQKINNSKLTIHNIELLNYFNNSLQTTIEDLKELNDLLERDSTSTIVQNKIKHYLSINKKIKLLLPSLIMETI